MQQKVVAITGASGHLGNILCKELAKKDLRLRVLLHRNKDELMELNADVIHGNILDYNSLLKLTEGAEIVYHLAALISIDKKDNSKVIETNIRGTINIINACKTNEVNKLIHFSTIHTLKSFGINEVLNEANPITTEPADAYEYSKAEAEKRILAASKNGLHTVILSPTAIIGPFDYQPSYLGQALIKIFNNSLPMLVSGGYDFVDVRDVVDAAIRAGEKGRKGERYILSGGWLSLKALAQKIEETTHHKTPKYVAPGILAKIGIPFIHLWAKLNGQHPLYTAESLTILKHSCRAISNSKARKELAFNPRPIEDTLKDTFEWFEQNKLT
jgi:dihydroflavonol-4-reductase